jgi:hypothetical protein
MKQILSRLFFWISALSFLFDADPLYGMSKDQAIGRCRERLTAMVSKSDLLPDNHNKTCFFDASRRAEATLTKLQQSSTPAEIYELSSKCHGALRTMEWLISEYGKAEQEQLAQAPKVMPAQMVQATKDTIVAPIKKEQVNPTVKSVGQIKESKKHPHKKNVKLPAKKLGSHKGAKKAKAI